MEKKTVFVKRYPSKGELPSEEDYYFCLDEYNNLNSCYFDGKNIINDNCVIINPEYWLEEIELPSEKEIFLEVDKIVDSQVAYGFYIAYGFYNGANFILNKLKGE